MGIVSGFEFGVLGLGECCRLNRTVSRSKKRPTLGGAFHQLSTARSHPERGNEEKLGELVGTLWNSPMSSPQFQ